MSRYMNHTDDHIYKVIKKKEYYTKSYYKNEKCRYIDEIVDPENCLKFVSNSSEFQIIPRFLLGYSIVYGAFSYSSASSSYVVYGTAVDGDNNNYLEYSVDGINWIKIFKCGYKNEPVSYGTSARRPIIDSDNHDITIKSRVIYIRGKFDQRVCFSNWEFKGATEVHVFGNINTLRDHANILLDIRDKAIYAYMFKDVSILYTAPDLPATQIDPYCYYNMFSGCSNLINVPHTLPVMSLSNNSYNSMFSGCASLENIPILPATTLASGCYSNMFSGCTSLENIPILPATTLASECYSTMFSGCTSLETIPSNFFPDYVDVAIGCYYAMFAGCTNLVNIFSVLPHINTYDNYNNVNYYCFSMFADCTSLQHIPSNFISKRELGASCYNSMFKNCTSLVETPCIEVYGGLRNQCFLSMFENCTSLTTIRYMSITQNTPTYYYQQACYRMFANCSSLTSVPYHTIISEYPYGSYQMFINCTSLETIFDDTPSGRSRRSLLASNLAYYDVQKGHNAFESMFENCTSLVDASYIGTITSSADEGCKRMFYNCTNLVHPPYDIPFGYDNGVSAYESMFENCISLTKTRSNDSELIYPTTHYSFYEKACYKMYKNCTSLNYTKNSVFASPYINVPSNYTKIIQRDVFANMFENCTSLISLSYDPELPDNIDSGYLPTNTNAEYTANTSFFEMFKGCTNLQKTPHIDANSLGWSTCESMFENCINLIDASPIISLGKNYGPLACRNMFKNCESLTILPTLWSKDDHAIIPISSRALEDIFLNCNNLHQTPVFRCNIIGDGISYSRSIFGETYVNNQNLIDASNFVFGDVFGTCTFVNMFLGCTNLEIPPIFNNTLSGVSVCESMFKDCTGLQDASTIAINVAVETLPNTALSPTSTHACRSMFEGCTSLTVPPIIYGKNIYEGAFARMFAGCTSLVNAPSMAQRYSFYPYCCSEMFEGCTSLTNVSAIQFFKNTITASAIDLYDFCYRGMFKDCTGLVNFAYLPATELGEIKNVYVPEHESYGNTIEAHYLVSHLPAIGCYESMFKGCTSLINAPNLPAISLSAQCYSNMFEGCTSLIVAPNLNANLIHYTTRAIPDTDSSLIDRPYRNSGYLKIADRAYYEMFKDCINLEIIPEIANHFMKTSTDSTYPESWSSSTVSYQKYDFVKAGGCAYIYVSDVSGNRYAPSSAIGRTTWDYFLYVEKPYYRMFDGCTKLRLYSESSDEHSREWKIPVNGAFIDHINGEELLEIQIINDEMIGMFANTGGEVEDVEAYVTYYY